MSWKQYISNISNGNGSAKKANRQYRQGNKSNFDINHSPMASNQKARAKRPADEEWVDNTAEKKSNVQIKVKSAQKPKVQSSSSNTNPTDDGERISGKLSINK